MFPLQVSLRVVCVILCCLSSACDTNKDHSDAPLNFLRPNPNSGLDAGTRTDDARNRETPCTTDADCADTQHCRAVNPNTSSNGACIELGNENEACRFGTECAVGLACVKQRGTVEGECQQLPSDCPSPPTCDCALELCDSQAGASCSVGSPDDPASSLTVTCNDEASTTTEPDQLMPDPAGVPVTLPFVVDDYFNPTYRLREYGNGGGSLEPLGCMSIRPGTVGDCHRFSWRWAEGSSPTNGYQWVLPSESNTPDSALLVAEGAQEVTFSAWGNSGPIVRFNVILIDPEGSQIVVSTDPIRLSSQPQDYSIDLSTYTYASVLSGFGWNASVAEQVTAVYSLGVYVDNIRWLDDSSCIPGTCQSLGARCGSVNDGCGDLIDCGPCSDCGNGQIDDGELCDSANLAGETCQGLGFHEGSLGCTDECTFDSSQCYTVRCPDNASYRIDGCVCDDGFIPSADNTECIEEPECDYPIYPLSVGATLEGRYTDVQPEEGVPEVVLDTHTGYMIQKCVAGVSGRTCNEGDYQILPVADAELYCNELTLGGFDDWALPPIEILASMIDEQGVARSNGIFRSSRFPNAEIPETDRIRQRFLISGTNVPHDDRYNWSRGMAHGTIGHTSGGVVRCARRSVMADMIEPVPRCITRLYERDPTSCERTLESNEYCYLEHFQDSMTGLEWKRYRDRYTAGQSFSNQEDKCDSLRENWRLPTLSEALTLFDYSKTEPPYAVYNEQSWSPTYWTNASSDLRRPSGVSFLDYKGRKWRFKPNDARTEIAEERTRNSDRYGSAEVMCVREIP